jgi:mannose-6-phosphate isomerase-like protein (cupin superfamily)
MAMSDTTNLVKPGERNYGLEHVAIGVDVRVSAQTFEGDQCVPWHRHTEVTDIFFCLEGVGRIQIKGQSEDVLVTVGQRYDVAPGLEHQVSSADGARCRMILIQGVGKADFIRSQS